MKKTMLMSVGVLFLMLSACKQQGGQEEINVEDLDSGLLHPPRLIINSDRVSDRSFNSFDLNGILRNDLGSQLVEAGFYVWKTSSSLSNDPDYVIPHASPGEIDNGESYMVTVNEIHEGEYIFQSYGRNSLGVLGLGDWKRFDVLCTYDTDQAKAQKINGNCRVMNR